MCTHRNSSPYKLRTTYWEDWRCRGKFKCDYLGVLKPDVENPNNKIRTKCLWKYIANLFYFHLSLWNIEYVNKFLCVIPTDQWLHTKVFTEQFYTTKRTRPKALSLCVSYSLEPWYKLCVSCGIYTILPSVVTSMLWCNLYFLYATSYVFSGSSKKWDCSRLGRHVACDIITKIFHFFALSISSFLAYDVFSIFQLVFNEVIKYNECKLKLVKIN